MLHYFYLVRRSWLEEMHTALSASHRQHSFTPCASLCARLLANGSIPERSLIHHASTGLAFDRTRWHALVGECLVFGADEMPRLPWLLPPLLCLLAPERLGADPAERAGRTPIEQVHYGARPLRFGGGWHRPDHVGWNDADDVHRLLAYLRDVAPSAWSAAGLTPLTDLTDDADRAEELAHLRDWWPALVEMYERARADDCAIVCERP
jgi:hypothetical protein